MKNMKGGADCSFRLTSTTRGNYFVENERDKLLANNYCFQILRDSVSPDNYRAVAAAHNYMCNPVVFVQGVIVSPRRVDVLERNKQQ